MLGTSVIGGLLFERRLRVSSEELGHPLFPPSLYFPLGKGYQSDDSDSSLTNTGRLASTSCAILGQLTDDDVAKTGPVISATPSREALDIFHAFLLFNVFF